MRVGGVEKGYPYTQLLVAAQQVSALGSSNKFLLDTVPSFDGDKAFMVTDFWVSLPQVRWVAPATAEPNNYSDALGILGALQVTLATSSKSPFAAMGNRNILDAVGWKGLEALDYVSNCPVLGNVRQYGDNIDDMEATAYGNFAKKERRSGWFSRQRPIDVFVVAGDNVDTNYVLRLPVGRRVGEGNGRLAVPGAYFTGCGCGQAVGAPGYIEWQTVLSEMMGGALSLIGSSFAVYVSGYWTHMSKVEIPVGLLISETAIGSNRAALKLPATGAVPYLAIRSELTAGGAETMYDSNLVDVRCGGVQVVADQPDVRRSMTAVTETRENWSTSLMGVTANANAPCGVGRFNDPSHDVLIAQGLDSLLECPGSDSDPLTVRLVTAGAGAGANDPNIVSAIYRNRTAESDRAHLELFKIPGSAIVNVPATIGAAAMAVPAEQKALTPAKG